VIKIQLDWLVTSPGVCPIQIAADTPTAKRIAKASSGETEPK
jgi:hypothetical protein